jgi:hypothetical protein
MAGEAGPSAGRGAPDGLCAGLIRAKLAPHRLPRGWLSRPQLLDELRLGRGRVLTLVSAPAGFGKTTLLTEWAGTDAATPFAWVTLDPGDEEPVRLWAHVVAAIAQHESTVGDRFLAALRSNPDRSPMPHYPYSSMSWLRGPEIWSSSSMTTTGLQPRACGTDGRYLLTCLDRLTMGAGVSSVNEPVGGSVTARDDRVREPSRVRGRREFDVRLTRA